MTPSLQLTGPQFQHTSDAPASKPVRILIIDDNAAKRTGLRAILAQLGHEIVEADSGLAGLRCVAAQDFAAILLDVRMPIMDGFETAALIRQRWQSEMTPIIFITAHAKNEILNPDLYAAGAVDFIFAPVDPDELRSKVTVFVSLFIRAEELAENARAVRTAVDQLRLLTDAAPVGIFQTDAEERYVYTNPRWSELTGIAAEEAIGAVWDSSQSAYDHGVSAQLADPDLAERWHRIQIPVRGADPRILLVTSKRMTGDDGLVSGWVGTLADVTAEHEAQMILSTARDKATETSRLKSDFLANMSHEIRTPMNGVIGMTELLLETDLDERQRDYAQTVRASGEALLTIIDDILDFSKVEAGMLELEHIDFCVETVVEEAMDLLAGSAQAKGLELLLAVNGSVPAIVRGDPGRIRQVLTNFVGNAIKFTREGEVIVRIAEVECSGDDVVLRFEVSDTGDGIASEKLALIFDPFVQADTSTSRRYGGTGLGLAITSKLIALMRGERGVTSILGNGSNFWFTVPVQASTSKAVLPPDTGLADVTALIVDDSATHRDVLAEYMSDWGMAVTVAGSGADALELLRRAAEANNPFAIALIDLTMPEMDGRELASAILAHRTFEPRVILMTSLGQDWDSGTPEESGTSASLTKPIHRAVLRRCLHAVLGLDRPEASESDGPLANRRTVSRCTGGRLLLAEDNTINQKVALAMLAGGGYSVDTVLDGVAAVHAAAGQHYDAILMDCQMPELNGYEATAAIRASEGSNRHTPIIAMTAGARREDREYCLAQGMDGYLSKPMSKQALLDTVASFVDAAA
ncbi:MAG: response regulator [Actinobacteria bacterium]|nr:response regulator [Actinomycetota bacterium]